MQKLQVVHKTFDNGPIQLGDAKLFGQPGEPYAERTDLGWAFSGPVKNAEITSGAQNIVGLTVLNHHVILSSLNQPIEPFQETLDLAKTSNLALNLHDMDFVTPESLESEQREAEASSPPKRQNENSKKLKGQKKLRRKQPRKKSN